MKNTSEQQTNIEMQALAHSPPKWAISQTLAHSGGDSN